MQTLSVPTLSSPRDCAPRDSSAAGRAGRRTAILLPPGSMFSESRPNSMETVVRTLAGAMPPQDVLILCSEGASDHGLTGALPLPQGPARLPAILKALRAFGPTLIEHHQQVKQALAIRRAMPGAAHALYRHNALKPPAGPFDAWRYNRRYGRLDGLIFVSESERRRFGSAFPNLSDRAWSVPNPIDAAPWLACPRQREPLIAFVGRAMPEKGLAVVCAALPDVLDRHPDWRVELVLGDWAEHRAWALQHIAVLDRFGGRVSLHRSAPLTEVRRRLRTAAIALTPSIWPEPFGLTALEAHAAGAALVSSGRGGLREASGPHALYLQEVTPQSVAAAIGRLIDNPARRVAMAVAAQRYVLEVHTPAKRAAELIAVRERIIERAAARFAGH